MQANNIQNDIMQSLKIKFPFRKDSLIILYKPTEDYLKTSFIFLIITVTDLLTNDTSVEAAVTDLITATKIGYNKDRLSCLAFRLYFF